MSDVEAGIRDVINGSGLPAEPSTLVVAEGATEVAAAIERACEQTIQRMYDSVEQNESMVRDQRKKVDDFAIVLRNYYKAHVGSLSEFLAHLQSTTDQLAAHVNGFEDRLRAGAKPRSGDD